MRLSGAGHLPRAEAQDRTSNSPRRSGRGRPSPRGWCGDSIHGSSRRSDPSLAAPGPPSNCGSRRQVFTPLNPHAQRFSYPCTWPPKGGMALRIAHLEIRWRSWPRPVTLFCGETSSPVGVPIPGPACRTSPRKRPVEATGVRVIRSRFDSSSWVPGRWSPRPATLRSARSVRRAAPRPGSRHPPGIHPRHRTSSSPRLDSTKEVAVMFQTKFTVNQHERVLAYRDGRLERVLEPGRHSLAPRTQLVRIDGRERIVTLAPQEVLTSDGVSLRVTAALVWSVSDPVALKDVLLPPELRAAYAELVSARQRGKAQLETARAETAALRSLANGAKLLDGHPALAKLRLVQALPSGSSLTVKLDE